MANTKRDTVAKAKCSVQIDFLEKKIFNFVENNNFSSTQKGDKFCQWILEFIFERSNEDIEVDMEIGGKSDNSIDAWFDDGNTLYIIQSKYDTSHSYAGMCQQAEDMRRLLENPYDYVGDNTYLREFAETLKEYKESKNIEIYYITNARITDETFDKVKKIKEQLENIYTNVSYEFMGLREIQHFILKSLQELPDEYRESPKKLLLKNHFKTQETIVAEVTLKELAKFVSENKEYLFFSNVRNYLESTSINKDISATFKEHPERFWYYNNGITILCDKMDPVEKMDESVKIYGPQIVNGCQTASTICKEFYKIDDKDKQNNKEGTILVKIIEDVNLKRKPGIIKYTNSQNTVSAMDFFALDEFHKTLKVRFAEYGFNYEIQRKESVFSKNLNKPAFCKRYT